MLFLMCSPSLLSGTCSVKPSLVLNVLFFLSCAQCAARLKTHLLWHWDKQIFNVHSRAALTQERPFLLRHQTAGRHGRGSGVWRQIMWRRSLHGLHRVCVFLEEPVFFTPTVLPVVSSSFPPQPDRSFFLVFFL